MHIVDNELRLLISSGGDRIPRFNQLGVEPTAHRRFAYKLITDGLANEVPGNIVSQFAVEMFPLVDFLTQPRSISDFQKMKMGILRILYKNADANETLHKLFWLEILCKDFGIFPCNREISEVTAGNLTPDDVWEKYELYTASPTDPLLKRISIKRASWLAVDSNDDEVRFGMVGGKYRLGLGVLDEQTELLKASKTALGTDGTLLVLLDKKDNIQSRKSQTVFCLDDEVRANLLTANPNIDAVTLVGKQDATPEEHKRYMQLLWKRINPSFYFVGARNDEYFSIFEEYARNIGVILLWLRDDNKTSTTQIISELQGKI